MESSRGNDEGMTIINTGPNDWDKWSDLMKAVTQNFIDQFGSEVLLTSFNMGEHSAKTTKKSTMVVETHTNYIREVKQNDEVIVSLSHLDHDNKRLH